MNLLGGAKSSPNANPNRGKAVAVDGAVPSKWLNLSHYILDVGHKRLAGEKNKFAQDSIKPGR